MTLEQIDTRYPDSTAVDEDLQPILSMRPAVGILALGFSVFCLSCGGKSEQEQEQDGSAGQENQGPLCERFCEVAYRCPDGVPCPDASCHDFDYCESNCKEDRTVADELGCIAVTDALYECASNQADACEAADPTDVFYSRCNDEATAMFDCVNETGGD